VLLVAEVDSVPYRAVTRLRDVSSRPPGFALIGGLAVIIRLGQAHRATNDVDTVSDDQEGLLDVLVGDGLHRQGNSVFLDSDLKLDVIDVSEGDVEYLPYATHRFAFDTRTPVDVVVRPRRATASASVTVDVARACALVAVKLGISEGVGRQRDPRKVGSDAFDVARLLQRFGPDALADELNALAGDDFVDRVAGLATRHLIESVDRTAAAIVRSSIQGVETIAVEQLELLGRAFTRRLRRS
jgi:hypothetical protein